MHSLLVDQSDWGKVRVTGEDRVRFLQGMLSNDVAKLEVGAFCRATLLSVKGRVLAVVDVLREEAAFLLLMEPTLTDSVLAVLEKHAIIDDVAFANIEVPVHRVWDSPASVWTAPPVLTPLARSIGEGAQAEAIEVRRVEAGLPKYGVDVSEDNFPFEVPGLVTHAISYQKGCYIGQEVVARADARGSATKRLCGILLGEAGAPPPAGAVVASATRDDAGQVTSSVRSPDFGVIALAYVHKSSWEPGTEVRVGEQRGIITALPFGS